MKGNNVWRQGRGIWSLHQHESFSDSKKVPASLYIVANRLEVIYRTKRKVEYHVKDFGWNIWKDSISCDWDELVEQIWVAETIRRSRLNVSTERMRSPRIKPWTLQYLELKASRRDQRRLSRNNHLSKRKNQIGMKFWKLRMGVISFVNCYWWIK